MYLRSTSARRTYMTLELYSVAFLRLGAPFTRPTAGVTRHSSFDSSRPNTAVRFLPWLEYVPALRAGRPEHRLVGPICCCCWCVSHARHACSAGATVVFWGIVVIVLSAQMMRHVAAGLLVLAALLASAAAQSPKLLNIQSYHNCDCNGKCDISLPPSAGYRPPACYVNARWGCSESLNACMSPPWAQC